MDLTGRKWDRLAGADPEAWARLCDQIAELEARKGDRMAPDDLELLREVQDYLEDHGDAEYFDGSAHPNKAMSLGVKLEALADRLSTCEYCGQVGHVGGCKAHQRHDGRCL